MNTAAKLTSQLLCDQNHGKTLALDGPGPGPGPGPVSEHFNKAIPLISQTSCNISLSSNSLGLWILIWICLQNLRWFLSVIWLWSRKCAGDGRCCWYHICSRILMFLFGLFSNYLICTLQAMFWNPRTGGQVFQPTEIQDPIDPGSGSVSKITTTIILIIIIIILTYIGTK